MPSESGDVLCRICERLVNNQVIAEHTRYCVLAYQCQQQTLASNVQLQKMIRLVKKKVHQRNQLQLAAASQKTPFSTAGVSILVGMTSVYAQAWYIALICLCATVYIFHGARGHAHLLKCIRRFVPPSMVRVSWLVAAHHDSRKAAPWQDTALLRTAETILVRLLCLESDVHNTRDECFQAGKALQKLQWQLESTDDYAGATIVGGAVAASHERLNIFDTLTDAEKWADSTIGDCKSVDAVLPHNIGKGAVKELHNSASESLRTGQSALQLPLADTDLDTSQGSSESLTQKIPPAKDASTLAHGSLASESVLNSPQRVAGSGCDYSTNSSQNATVHVGSEQVIKSGRTNETNLSASHSALSMTTRFNVPSISDFDLIRPISKGAFGRVYLARKKRSGATASRTCTCSHRQ